MECQPRRLPPPQRPHRMSAVLRQQRFFAGAKARLERKGEWGRLAESGEAAVAAWDAWDPPVGQDQVHVVPSLLRVGALASGRDATADLEDEDLLFESDGADPDSETDADDDDTNLGEPRTVAQAQEARAGAGCTDLDEAIAAAARSEQAGAAAGEADLSFPKVFPDTNHPIARVRATGVSENCNCFA